MLNLSWIAGGCNKGRVNVHETAKPISTSANTDKIVCTQKKRPMGIQGKFQPNIFSIKVLFEMTAQRTDCKIIFRYTHVFK